MVKPLENLSGYRVVLASNSPRRRELLGKLGIGFEVRDMRGVKENYPHSLDAIHVPQFISREKAAAQIPCMASDELLITADTVVAHNNMILGKPHDRYEALEMLKSLSGDTHTVVTGVTLTTISRQSTFAEASLVRFSRLDDEEIEYYVDNYKPFDKAGSYGIQEWIGLVGIESIEGDFFNVMGLPVRRLYSELKGF